MIAGRQRGDGELAGEPVQPSVGEHGGTSGDDVELVGQRAGIPAAQREHAQTLRGRHLGRPARRRMQARHHAFRGADLILRTGLPLGARLVRARHTRHARPRTCPLVRPAASAGPAVGLTLAAQHEMNSLGPAQARMSRHHRRIGRAERVHRRESWRAEGAASLAVVWPGFRPCRQAEQPVTGCDERIRPRAPGTRACR